MDVTKTAVSWSDSVRQCKLWNTQCAYIERTSSFMYIATGRDPVSVKVGRDLSNTMANRVTMRLDE
jgi:hypothetical protein